MEKGESWYGLFDIMVDNKMKPAIFCSIFNPRFIVHVNPNFYGLRQKTYIVSTC